MNSWKGWNKTFTKDKLDEFLINVLSGKLFELNMIVEIALKVGLFAL